MDLANERELVEAAITAAKAFDRLVTIIAKAFALVEKHIEEERAERPTAKDRNK